jgi:hypothetical protein
VSFDSFDSLIPTDSAYLEDEEGVSFDFDCKKSREQCCWVDDVTANQWDYSCVAEVTADDYPYHQYYINKNKPSEKCHFTGTGSLFEFRKT